VALPAPRRSSSFRLITHHPHHRAGVGGATGVMIDRRLSRCEPAHQAHAQLPVSEWKASHVLAWLELDMHMTAYRQACFDNIKSGKVTVGRLASTLSLVGNESVPIQLAQCWFPGLAISNAKI